MSRQQNYYVGIRITIAIIVITVFAAKCFIDFSSTSGISYIYSPQTTVSTPTTTTVDVMIFNIFWPLLEDVDHPKHPLSVFTHRAGINCAQILEFNYSKETNTDITWKYVFVGDIAFLSKHENISKCMQHPNALSIHLPYDELPHEQHAKVSNANCAKKGGGPLGYNLLNWLNRIWLSKRAIILNLVKHNAAISSYVHPTNTMLIYMDIALREKFWPTFSDFMSRYYQFDGEYVYTLRYLPDSTMLTKHTNWFHSAHCVTAPITTASLSFFTYRSGLKYEEQFNYYLNVTTHDIISNKTLCKCFDEEIIQSEVERKSTIFTKPICRPHNNTLFGTAFKNMDDRKKFIFINVPKTGGSTIERLLFHRVKPSEHKTITQYMGSNVCAEGVTFCCANNHFIFAFVRNPYLRTISMFNYFKNGGNRRNDLRTNESIAHQFDRLLSLDEFVDYFIETKNKKFREHVFFKHFRQSDYLVDPKGVYKVHFIGRFETFMHDIKYLANLLSFNMNNISHARVTKYHRDDLWVTPKFVNFINDYVDSDFLHFNYIAKYI